MGKDTIIDKAIEYVEELFKGNLLIGDVAFKTRVELENCKSEAGDEWDEDEIYFVIDEIKKSFPQAQFEQKSYCSGIITIKNSEARQI